MQLGIFAKTFPRPTLEETLDTVVYHGLTHVQFNMSCAGLPTLPDRIDENLCRTIARSLRERGLTMAAISGTFNICDPNPIRLLENLHRLETLAAACRWLDTRIITLCTGTLDAEDMWKHHPDNVKRSTWERLVGSMRLAVAIADRHEVTLAFEPEIHNVVSSVMRARRLLDEIGSPWLKVVIDPANLFSRGDVRPFSELLCEAFDWLGKDIVLAHAKPPQFDQTPGAEDWLVEFLGAEYREHVEKLKATVAQANRGKGRQFGGSDFDATLAQSWFFAPYMAALKAVGYAGAVIMHGVPESQVEQLANFLGRNLKTQRMDPGN